MPSSSTVRSVNFSSAEEEESTRKWKEGGVSRHSLEIIPEYPTSHNMSAAHHSDLATDFSGLFRTEECSQERISSYMRESGDRDKVIVSLQMELEKLQKEIREVMEAMTCKDEELETERRTREHLREE